MTTQYPEPQYALWSDPESSVSVVYSIPAFRDLEFACEDGFRKIPHGGLEVGGLLLGQVEGDSIYVEGIRTIDCEYARGPSFVLSDKDLAKLREQVAFLESDPAAAGLRPIGWFISHARSQLQMHQREVELFNDLFPGSAVTVLVRPGPMGPFPFSFFVRDSAGSIEVDGTHNAVLLPRVEEGVSAERENPLASPPAPIRDTVSPRPKSVESPVAPVVIESEPEDALIFEPEEIGKYEILEVEEAPPLVEAQPPVDAEPEPEPEPDMQAIEETFAPPIYEPAVHEPQPVAPEPAFKQEPEPEEQPVEHKETKAEAHPPASVVDSGPSAVVEEPKPEEPKPLKPEVLEPAPAKPKPPKSGKWSKRPVANDIAAQEVTPSTALAEIPVPPSFSAKAEPRVHEVPEEPADDRTSKEAFDGFWARPSLVARLRNSRMTVAAILLLAAVLGSGIGYWAYSRLPSATIPLRVDAQSSDLVITWSPAETRGSAYAALRIDNADPTPLSEEEKSAGKTQLKIPADNVKIELIARHWMRDSRGIVRYINGVPAPAELPSGATAKPITEGAPAKKRR